MGLKPQNIVQAAEADLKRQRRNLRRAELMPFGLAEDGVSYEPYAFHRKHVRRVHAVRELILLALMDSNTGAKTAKPNTRLIYGDARLLVDAIKLTPAEDQ
jgi:hypothetical protein